ncbi:hypothetical protein SK128_002678 [Halocaridina rubra]|uniref:Carbohydrate sulfotransferase n=1 Tax=Halocaridina rubra TaxID=373956 RepID=A0AAN8WPQ2_HALRR
MTKEKQKLAYCPIYKAGSTSWAITLSDIGGHPYRDLRKTQGHTKVIAKIFPYMSMRDGLSVIRSLTSFVIVRHPLERFLSAYRDKFEGASKDYYYLRYGENMVRYYRNFPTNITTKQLAKYREEVKAKVIANQPLVGMPGNPYAEPPGPTFPEFVKYILYRRFADDHWRTYNEHCSPCAMKYKFIIRFENMDEEGKLFLHYLDRTASVNATIWANPTKGGSTSKDIKCFYYKKLSYGTIQQIVTRYKTDLELFEYDPKEYLHCANDYNKFYNGSVLQ